MRAVVLVPTLILAVVATAGCGATDEHEGLHTHVHADVSSEPGTELGPEQREALEALGSIGGGSADAGDGADWFSQSPESMDQMMEQFIAMGQPSDGHRALEPLTGMWHATSKHWMLPGQPPVENEGTMHNRWILGGRFLMSEFRGEFAGQPFEGLGLLGFDNAKQQYTGTWMDSMGTYFMPIGFGTSDETGKVITMRRMMDDPMTGMPMEVRDVTTILNDDEHTYEMYMGLPDGSEMMAMKIWYTRS